MSVFPTETDLHRLNVRVAKLLGRPEGLRDSRLLRAILVGVRMSRSSSRPRVDVFFRAAALLHQVISLRPFLSANRATALAAALLYLSRHGYHVVFGKGQAASLVRGVLEDTMDQDRVASLFRVMVGQARPAGRPTSRSAV